jgi:hypothetical protein
VLGRGLGQLEHHDQAGLPGSIACGASVTQANGRERAAARLVSDPGRGWYLMYAEWRQVGNLSYDGQAGRSVLSRCEPIRTPPPANGLPSILLGAVHSKIVTVSLARARLALEDAGRFRSRGTFGSAFPPGGGGAGGCGLVVGCFLVLLRL